MRCDDVWYNKVLDECRRGALSSENYAYLHGLPTFTSPAAACTCHANVIKDPILGPVRSDWREYFLEGGDMEALQTSTTGECMTCRTERHDRQRVVTDLEHMRAEYHQPPFESAPTLYSYNEPRFFVLSCVQEALLSKGMCSCPGAMLWTSHPRRRLTHAQRRHWMRSAFGGCNVMTKKQTTFQANMR